MQHKEGASEGYFAWCCRKDGSHIDGGSASDGELYFITSLIFASNLWGNDTGIDYLAEAQHILDCAMEKMEQIVLCRLFIKNTSLLRLYRISSVMVLPILLTICLPFTKFGRVGLTMDVLHIGKNVLNAAAIFCIRQFILLQG